MSRDPRKPPKGSTAPQWIPLDPNDDDEDDIDVEQLLFSSKTKQQQHIEEDREKEDEYVEKDKTTKNISTTTNSSNIFLNERITPTKRKIDRVDDNIRKFKAEYNPSNNDNSINSLSIPNDYENITLKRIPIQSLNNEDNNNSNTTIITTNIVSNQNQQQQQKSLKIDNIINMDPNTLPITSHREEILDRIRDNQVVVISGDTGSGKSTQIPKYIFKDCESNNRRCSIICSQPRRIAAISLARRVSSEMNDVEFGSLVGYQISMDKMVSPSTQILFCTAGILVERLIHQHSKSINNYTHIIIDEVHERSLEIDLILVLLKKILPKNPNVRLILMSATFDCELFSNYFQLVPNLKKKNYFSTEFVNLHAIPFVNGFEIVFKSDISEISALHC